MQQSQLGQPNPVEGWGQVSAGHSIAVLHTPQAACLNYLVSLWSPQWKPWVVCFAFVYIFVFLRPFLTTDLELAMWLRMVISPDPLVFTFRCWGSRCAHHTHLLVLFFLQLLSFVTCPSFCQSVWPLRVTYVHPVRLSSEVD